MTPKEKAIEIVDKFINDSTLRLPKPSAITCALISVNEILGFGHDPKDKPSFRVYQFYSNVKIELLKINVI